MNPNEQEYSEDYPIGGMVEQFDIEREKKLMECEHPEIERKEVDAERYTVVCKNCHENLGDL